MSYREAIKDTWLEEKSSIIGSIVRDDFIKKVTFWQDFIEDSWISEE